MKLVPHKALLRNVLAPDVELDRAVGKLDSGKQRDAVPGAGAETNTASRPVREARGGAVDDLQAGGRGGFLLGGDAGGAAGAGRSQQRGGGNAAGQDGPLPPPPPRPPGPP